jgi:hypothetical protein
MAVSEGGTGSARAKLGLSFLKEVPEPNGSVGKAGDRAVFPLNDPNRVQRSLSME